MTQNALRKHNLHQALHAAPALALTALGTPQDPALTTGTQISVSLKTWTGMYWRMNCPNNREWGLPRAGLYINHLPENLYFHIFLLVSKIGNVAERTQRVIKSNTIKKCGSISALHKSHNKHFLEEKNHKQLFTSMVFSSKTV